jgi:hypothetical protein
MVYIRPYYNYCHSFLSILISLISSVPSLLTPLWGW